MSMRLVVVLSLIFCSGCTDREELDASVEETQLVVVALRSNIDELQSRMDDLESSIGDLQTLIDDLPYEVCREEVMEPVSDTEYYFTEMKEEFDDLYTGVRYLEYKLRYIETLLK